MIAMQEAEAGSAWFVPFAAACAVALALGIAFLATWAGRAADRRRIAAVAWARARGFDGESFTIGKSKRETHAL